MGKIIQNIKAIYGIDTAGIKVKKGKSMSELQTLENAWIKIEDDLITDFGEMADVDTEGHEIIDVSGQSILPTYCDSHTHLVFAATREKEFEDRIHGLSYEEIAQRGGGILNSVEKLRQMSEDELFEASKDRLKRVIQHGTGAIEIKSGYGLSLESELKMLRVIRRLKNLNWIPIKSTLLAAHALPLKFKDNKAGYMDYIENEILPAVSEEALADYVDIFCEKGYFDLEDTVRMMALGSKYNLKSKIHVNQFNILGGVEAAVEAGAVSVDHLEYLDENDILALKKGETIATALPSCSFFLQIPYTPVHKLMENDIALALASDYNPGSTPGGNMNFVFSLACVQMKMTPTQALNSITINGAAAMELSDQVGSISKGKKANLILTDKIESLAYIPYSFSDNAIDRVMINGEWFSQQ